MVQGIRPEASGPRTGAAPRRSTPPRQRTWAAPRPDRATLADADRLAFDIVGVALIALHVVLFAMRNTHFQGDFRTYVAAAGAALQGIDPYPPEHLTAFTHRPTLPFVYPPITLLAFTPLTALSLKTATALWMAVNVTLLAGLMVAWWRWLGAGVGLLPFALVAVFAWNSSALACLSSGNVALFEAVLIWAALACFARGWRTAFAALIVVAACFKLMPAALLLLLLVPTERNVARLRALFLLLAALAALVALVLVPVVVGPASNWVFFMQHLPRAETMGPSNPGALAFFTAVVQSRGIPEAQARGLGLAAWGAFTVILIAASGPFLRHVFRARDGRLAAMAALFFYVLIEPRPMAYGFILLTPAVWFFSPRPFHDRTGRLLMALVLTAQGLTGALKHWSNSLVFVYAPFLLSLCLWLLVLETARSVIRETDELPAAA